MQCDYLIVGAGFFGSICAYELNKLGFKCIVLDRRSHIGGNCYTEKKDNINIHKYGPHIFHTSNEKVWKWINQFTSFNNFINSPVANYKNEIYSLPFNMWTFNKLWDVTSPDEAKKIIEEQGKHITWEPDNLEDYALKNLGKDIYEKLVKGYTEKQWMKPSKYLPKEILKRVVLRFTYNNNYFNDVYQGIPIGGYTNIFLKLLKDIDIRLNVDYLKNRSYWNGISKNIIYTGPIDEFFDYKHGYLEYKTVRLVENKLFTENYQGVAVANYTDINIPYTRSIEHKHFENSESPVTWVSKEYPEKYVPKKNEAYYPLNDYENNKIYNLYKEEANSLKNVYFGGRLAEYKYYDMDKIIERSLKFIENLNI